MAATELDKLWDGWVSTLSASNEKTLALLDANQAKAARDEFRTRFVPTVKKIYTEAPQTYPTRFAKINDWCSWVKNLYTVSLKADRALAANNTTEATQLLAALREHFYSLHRETETLKANDWIYAFVTASAKEKPTVDELKALRDAVEKAPLSTKAQANADAFNKAKADWLAQVDPVLKGGSLDASKLQSLRTASDTFYRAFGVQFE
ncbi:MAG TPA: hypothetical protein VHP11_04975 [Tepidisphaeraceae bacterium]|nr:hypothetical protein [Tepidisphaeraceae bacterium]